MAEVQEVQDLAQIQDKVQALSIQNPEFEWLSSTLLGNQIKIVLTDSREIIGTLQCADHLANVVLIGATEVISADVVRNLGSVIVPSKGIKEVFMLKGN